MEPITKQADFAMASRSLQERVESGHDWIHALDMPFSEYELFLSTNMGKYAAWSLFYPVTQLMIIWQSVASGVRWRDDDLMRYRTERYEKVKVLVKAELDRVNGIRTRLETAFQDATLPDINYPRAERVVLRAMEQVGVNLAEYIDTIDQITQWVDRLWFGQYIDIHVKNEIFVEIQQSISTIKRYRYRQFKGDSA